MFHQNISMRGPSFLWLTRTLIKVLLFQETSPAPQKVLIVHLLFLCSYCASWRKSTKMFHQNVAMRGPSFLCPTWNFDQSASIPRNFSCPPQKSYFLCPTWNFDQSASIPRNLSCLPKSSDCALVIFIRSHFIFTLIHFFHSVFFFVFSLTYHAGGYRAASTVMQQI